MREHRLFVLDGGLLARVEVLLQVDQARPSADHTQDLRLPIHHVLVFEYLLDGHEFSRLLPLGLNSPKQK